MAKKDGDQKRFLISREEAQHIVVKKRSYHNFIDWRETGEGEVGWMW